MSDFPEIKSKEQIYQQIIETIISRSKVLNDVNPGSVLDSLVTAFAEAGFKLSADMIALIDSLSIDRAQGIALRNIAVDKDVPIFSATSSTGYVNIIDTSFEKIESKIYPGLPAPVAGTNTVHIIDGSAFPTTGKIYIGRGTNSIEGPLDYTSVVGVPAINPEYYTITLAGTTTKFHNLSESVILAQGGTRIIPVGTSVKTPQGVSADSVTFKTTTAATIIDGEIEVSNIPIISDQVGTIANVAKGAIVEVTGLPFSASCTNPLPLTNARPDDDDEAIRARIKAYEQLKSKGTEDAIKNAAIGVTAPDELKRVVSASVERTSTQEQFLIIDDGSGYEPISSGIGLEQLIDEALGGESEIQLENPMIQKATVTTLNSAPFAVSGGQTLVVSISGMNVPTHTFSNDDFKVPGSATAYEIAASINSSNQNLPYVARTYAGGTKVGLTPKDRNDIQVDVSSSANEGLNFQTNQVFTVRLYRNDKQTYQDGLEAFVESKTQDSWSSVASGDKIRYLVDNTTYIDITVTDAMFQVYGPSLNVNKDQPITIWAQVLNSAMPGVEVTVNGQKLRFTSRAGESNSAAIQIVTDDTDYKLGQSLFGTNVSIKASGISSDYTLNLKTGQLEWTEPFVAGEFATAGSKFTRAKIESAQFTSGSVSLGNEAKIFVIVDGASEFVTLDYSLADGIDLSLASAAAAWSAASAYLVGDYVTHLGNIYQALRNISAGTNPSPDVTPSDWTLAHADEAAIRATGSIDMDAPWINSQAGDWLILWKDYLDTALNSWNTANQGAWRVKRKLADKVLVINHPGAVAESALILSNKSRLTSVRSDRQVQYVLLETTGPNSITSLQNLVDAMASKIIGVKTSIVNSRARVESKTLNENISEIFVAALSDNAKSILGFDLGVHSAVPSHNGYIESEQAKMFGSPTFKILEIDADTNLTDTTFDNSKYLLADGTRNDLIRFLRPDSGQGLIVDSATNDDTVNQVRDFDAILNVLSFKDKPVALTDANSDTQLIMSNTKAEKDRFVIHEGLVFDPSDTISFVVDSNITEKSYLSKVARRVSVASSPAPTSSTLSLNDDETALPLNSPSLFEGFDFNDFKLWIRARGEAQGIKLKFQDFGPAGSRNGIAFSYPENGDSELSHTHINNLISAVNILLASGPERAITGANSWTDQSGWTVSAPVVTGNMEEVVVQHALGVGLTPNLLGSGGPVIGDIANINPASGFRTQNEGKFKVTDVTATNFKIQAPLGTFIQDNPVVADIVYPDQASAGLPFGFGTAQVRLNEKHNVTVGQKIGIYGTNPTDFVGAWLVESVIDAFNFRMTFTGSDGDDITTVQRILSSTPGQFLTLNLSAGSLGAITSGSRVRVSNVPNPNGSVNGVYTCSVGTTPTQAVIQFDPPSLALPGATSNSSLVRTDDIVVVNSTSHGLVDGDTVIISGVTPASFNGTYKVFATTLNTFNYANIGVDESATVNGTNQKSYAAQEFVRRDFGITTRESNGTTRTITTAFSHSLSNGNTVVVSGVGVDYDGVFVISSVTSNTFDYSTSPSLAEAPTASGGNVMAIYQSSVATIGIPGVSPDWTNISAITGFNPTAGRIDQAPTTFGNIARVLQSQENLKFYPVTSTRQDVVDYIGSALSDVFEASVVSGPTTLMQSNEQYYTGMSYVGSGNITITPLLGSYDRLIQMPAVVAFEKGATINFTLPSNANALRADIHAQDLQVIDVDITGTILRVRSSRLSDPSETALALVGASWVVSQGTVGLGSAESYIKSTVEGSPWAMVLKSELPDMEANDKAYLIVTTAEQLVRFTSQLATTGMSDIAEVVTGITDTTIQVKTDTFGSEGSMRLSGGKGNISIAAATGSGAVRNQLAGIDILKDLRKAFVPGSTVEIGNTMVQNKDLGINASTAIQITTASPTSTTSKIYSKTALFQNKRTIVHAQDQNWKIEKHGEYMCLSLISGTDALLETVVKEGDWLELRNATQTEFNASAVLGNISRTNNVTTINVTNHGFVAGQLVQVSGITNSSTFNGLFTVREVLSANSFTYVNEAADFVAAAVTGASRKVLRQVSVSADNLGQFKVAEVFGNAVWFKNEAGVEQLIPNVPTNVINFYSYDSVMPGDKVRISGSALGTSNVGTYEVADMLDLFSSTEIIVTGLLAFAGLEVGGVLAAADRTGGTVTITTSTTHGLVPGDIIWTRNLSSLSNVDAVVCIAGTTGSTIKYAEAGSNIASFTPPSNARVYTHITLGAQSNNFALEEKEPITLVKKVLSNSTSSNSNDYTFIGLDDSSLISRVAPQLGGYVRSLSKLGVDESTKVGLDAYRYNTGLLAEVYKVIYGDPSNPAYPGIRAAGADITIEAPIVRRITTSISVRVKSGIPFSEIITSVKSAATSYINSRGVGEAVSISAMISEIQKVDGILAVEVDETATKPTPNQGIIIVGPSEIARVLDIETDILASIIGG